MGCSSVNRTYDTMTYVCFVIFMMLIGVLAVLGGCLMGLATPANFSSPMFIGGFVCLMILAITLIVYIIWCVTSINYFYIIAVIAILFCSFAIVGGCLMGLASPPKFPTPMFIGGFALIMLDALFFIAMLLLWFCFYNKKN